MHSCRKVPLGSHFENKPEAQELFTLLFEQIETKMGKCKIISLPCCVHLYGKYDFLAALPKKDRLEVRFALNEKLEGPRIKQCVPMSAKVFKNCLDINAKSDIDDQLLIWLDRAYHMKG